MPKTKAILLAGRFYGLLGSVAANRARILLPVPAAVAIVLMATGCGDNGGGGGY